MEMQIENKYDQYRDYEKIDIMMPGEDNFAGSFILFRGTQMKNEWIEPYY